MVLPHVNFLAVLASTAVVFVLGGIWYSPVLFAKKWLALMGKTEADMKKGYESIMPLVFIQAALCGAVISWVLAVLLNHFANLTPLRGAMVGTLCWMGFAGATSYANVLFNQRPKALWLIDSGYNLVSFILAGIILAAWR